MNLWIVYACSVLIAVGPIAVLALTRGDRPSQSLLDSYFRIRSWETARDRALLRVLGVRVFAWLLALWYQRVLFAANKIVGVRLFRQPALSADQWRRLVGGLTGSLRSIPNRRERLEALRWNSKRYELIHLIMLAPSLVILACFAAAGHWMASAAFAGLTWMMNIWPILFQRTVRARIESILG